MSTETNLFGEEQPAGDPDEIAKLTAAVQRLGEQVADAKLTMARADGHLAILERSDCVPEMVKMEIGRVRTCIKSAALITP